MSSLPDFERLSYPEPNVQAKVLGVLLGDDYRACFLPRFLQRAGLEGAAGWASFGSQAVFFTRPLLAYLREQAAPENANQAQRDINRFLGLPPGFALRRNTDGSLTHPRGWNTRYIAEMLAGNRDLVASLGRGQCEPALWLMEEMANTEVDLILQMEDRLIFCEVKWLSGLGGASQKPALKGYMVTQLTRQVLAGLYLEVTCGCTVQYLLLDRHHGRDRKTETALGRLTELVPSADEFYPLHHASWRDVYEAASECLPAGHGLLSYMGGKRAKQGKGSVRLV